MFRQTPCEIHNAQRRRKLRTSFVQRTILASTNGFRIYVTNLNNSISRDDVAEIFASVARVIAATVFVSGDGQHEAEVVFTEERHAQEAVRVFDMCTLDDTPMRVKILHK